jgi:ferritin-like metal-binding protein YciE
MPKDKTLETLFEDGLRDAYYAERKVLAALRKQPRAAQAPEPRAAFERHREGIEAQNQPLGRSSRRWAGAPRARPAPRSTRASWARRGRPNMIGRYGTLAAWARRLGMDEAERPLRETLAEEERADQLLAQLAEPALDAAA